MGLGLSLYFSPRGNVFYLHPFEFLMLIFQIQIGSCSFDIKLELEKLVYICCSSLRLLRKYINEVYPAVMFDRCILDSNEKPFFAESVCEVRQLLRVMLSTPVLNIPSHGKKGKRQKGD